MMVPNPGFLAGIAKRREKAPADKLHWSLKGAPMRKKDLKLSALEAIALGRKLRNDITQKMIRVGLLPEDSQVLCVFAQPDLSALIPFLLPIPVVANGKDIELVQQFQSSLPIGFLIFTWDKKGPQAPIHGHARPLIVENPRSLHLNAAALRAYETKLRENLTAGGLKLPEALPEGAN